MFGSGPYLSRLCPEDEWDRSCPASWPDSSEHWETGTGRNQKSLEWLYRKVESLICFCPSRFWWERNGVFTRTQRRHLHNVSLSRIICDNSHISRVPVDPFSRTESPEDMLACSHPLIPHLDLGPWKEPHTGEEVGKKKICTFMVIFLKTLSPPDPVCGPIPRIHSGYSLLCNFTILYQCRVGFRLLGSASISCDAESQKWSSPPPTCQGRRNISANGSYNPIRIFVRPL